MKTLKSFNFNLLIISFFMLISVFIIGRTASAATYYVSPMGNDSNDGSMNTPFQTIQKAANIVNPGDIVIVKDGTYTGTSTPMTTITRGGTAGNPITFTAENTLGAVLDGQGSRDMFIVGANYIIIKGFEMTNGSTHPIAILGAFNVKILNNKIHNTARRQIACTDAWFDIGHGPVYADPSSSYITIDSNLMYDNGRLPMTDHTCNDSTVCSHFSMSTPCTLNFDYNHDHAMYINRSIHVTISNNIVYNNAAGWCVQFKGYGPSTYSSIINNTFDNYNPGRNGHIVIDGPVDHINIQNNISTNANGACLMSVLQTNDTNLTFYNNLLDNGNLYCGTPDSSYTASGNVFSSNPQYVNGTNHDYHLQSTSPAIDAGLATNAPNHDFDNNPRPLGAGYDIGAYEYVSGQPAPAPEPAPAPTGDTTPPAPPPPPPAADTTPPAPPSLIEVK